MISGIPFAFLLISISVCYESFFGVTARLSRWTTYLLLRYLDSVLQRFYFSKGFSQRVLLRLERSIGALICFLP